MIRIRTVKNMARKGLVLFRVRRRIWVSNDVVRVAKGRPDSWPDGWEEEYYSNFAYATEALKDKRGGFIDQVRAEELLASLEQQAEAEGPESELMEDFSAGRLRSLWPRVVPPGEREPPETERDRELNARNAERVRRHRMGIE